MKYLLLGGTQSTGKSGAIWRLAHTLSSKGFTPISNTIPPTFTDFTVVLEGLDKNGNKIIILINSPTDEPDIIFALKNYYDKLPFKIDIFISSVRDPDWWVRKVFFNTFPINPSSDFLIEIPLARILKQRNDFHIALSWYEERLDTLILHTLNNSPFNI